MKLVVLSRVMIRFILILCRVCLFSVVFVVLVVLVWCWICVRWLVRIS